MRILSVASECVPFVKTGGLADVVGALPSAMADLGVEMRTLIPGYTQVLEKLGALRKVAELGELFGGKATLQSLKLEGETLYVLRAPHLFERSDGIYLDGKGQDWADNPERFAALCRAAEAICEDGLVNWQPDVLHGHDWQAGLASYYTGRRGTARKTRSVLTIHNIAFHGIADPAKRLALGVAPADFTRDGVEFWGKISALKAGLIFSDRLTTVSPTYAQELLTPEFGMGMDGVMRMRRDDLRGILNGIDLDVWNPAEDRDIRRYKTARGKAANKRILQKEFGLAERDGPLCVVVSRLSQQKGLDLLLEALPTLISGGGQLALLGTGDAALERAFIDAGLDENVGVRIGYDEKLAHRMIAGGDAILVPSRFEPCGLTQLYGLRYGTIPLVALTGGLADTVINASPAALAMGAASGIQFNPVSVEPLRNAIAQLCGLYKRPAVWNMMQKNAMAQPVGWDQSAAEYLAVYRELVASSA